MSHNPPPHNPPPWSPPQYPAAHYPPQPYPPAYWPGAPGGGAYPLPARPANRPGLISGVGVVSIFVAALSLLASIFTGVDGFWMFRVSDLSAEMNRETGTSSTSIAPPGMRQGGAGGPAAPAKPVQGSDGLGEQDRQKVAEVLQTMEVIPPERLRQLDWMLAQSGQQIFPTGPTGVSAD